MFCFVFFSFPPLILFPIHPGYDAADVDTSSGGFCPRPFAPGRRRRVGVSGFISDAGTLQRVYSEGHSNMSDLTL